jgi:DNA-3-methyladenine glycosylase II
LLAISEEALRQAGLSRPKVGHVRALGSAVMEGRLDLVALREAPDEAAVAARNPQRNAHRLLVP